MTDNVTLMDAPENCGGITIEGTTYEVDNGQALIPAHLTSRALEHGFKIAVEQPKKAEAPAKADPVENEPVKEVIAEEETQAEDAEAPAKADRKKK